MPCKETSANDATKMEKILQMYEQRAEIYAHLYQKHEALTDLASAPYESRETITWLLLV